MRNTLFILLTLFLRAVLAQATTYYVRATGNDSQTGTTPATAWQTVARASAQHYQPGDRLLFEGGQTFGGGLWLRPTSQGTPEQPIVISSFGLGPATIASGNGFGFYAHNAAGIELHHLIFRGSGRLSNTSSGVIFYLDSANTNLRHLRLDSLDVSGYRGSGLSLGSWKGLSGYTDVRITNCQTHANGEAGLSSYAEALAAHHNWYVGRCQAYDNAGRADVTTTHTGNGIVLAGIDGALIEECAAYNNGWLNANPSGGPVGIWGWACNKLVIQHCESHHNRSGTAHDGGGFDIDGGCTNSVLQYNYSHDNDGPGYLLAQYPGAAPMHDVTIRYNVSENDARRYNQGAIMLWSSGANGGIQRARIHNNTVVLSPPANGSFPRAVFISSEGVSDVTLRNNVLTTSGGLAVVTSYASSGVRLEGNCYWGGATALLLDWRGTTYNSLSAWRAATGQERLADSRLTGLQADPQLRGASAPATATEPALPYSPLPESPVQGSGLNLLVEFNLDPGPQDLLGAPTPTAPVRGNIGALEAAVAAGPLPVVLSAFTVTQSGAGALLSWNTASELNNAWFVVESSPDGQAFTALGQLNGHGSSAQPQAYTFSDANLARYASSTIYYRLRQVDINQHVTYSPVRVLTGIQAAVATGARSAVQVGVLVAPNPAQVGSTVLVWAAGPDPVQLFSAHGQVLTSVRSGANGTAELSVAGLAAGVYLVRCGLRSTRLLLSN